MFTGIIKSMGTVTALEERSGDLRITISAPDLPWEEVELGDSIATNGVCLTVVAMPSGAYVADVSVETINLTTVSQWRLNDRVNLEMALTPQSRLGGHLVSGHVDGVGEVLSRQADARSERFRLSAPQSLARYIAHKGSITVDGTSLTVNAVDGNEFELNIVPHTLSETIMGGYTKGSQVNLEVDVIARYLERLLTVPAAEGSGAINADVNSESESFLAEHGYLKR
ncbi:MAG: riboflavin synthase [Alteromonadaceae bacterium]|nr:MAG: riboflavin synthase [Alteromonadaceae bacterium]